MVFTQSYFPVDLSVFVRCQTLWYEQWLHSRTNEFTPFAPNFQLASQFDFSLGFRWKHTFLKWNLFWWLLRTSFDSKFWLRDWYRSETSLFKTETLLLTLQTKSLKCEEKKGAWSKQEEGSHRNWRWAFRRVCSSSLWQKSLKNVAKKWAWD